MTQTQQLQEFDSLSAEIAIFVAPTLQIAVVDAATSQAAIETAQALKELAGRVEKKRKELVGPLNDQVKVINDYCKRITAPIAEGDGHVRGQLNAFAAEQEKIRREMQLRLQREKEEADRLARVERERIEAELQAKQEAEAEEHAEAANIFGPEGGDIDAANAAMDEKLTREWEEKQSELNRQEAIRAIEHKAQTFDVNQNQIKNTRTTWAVKSADLSQVPKDFLIITLNEKAALAAKKAGVNVAGVVFEEITTVAIGAKTRNPLVGRS